MNAVKINRVTEPIKVAPTKLHTKLSSEDYTLMCETYTLERINDIFEAMERCSNENIVVPIELITELKELIGY